MKIHIQILGVLFWIFFIMFSSLFIMAVLEDITEKVIGTQEVKCYDRFRNEILNQTCIEDIYGCGVITMVRFGCERQQELLNETLKEEKK